MTRPDYIARGGDLVMGAPLELTKATMYAFLVNADLAALTAICDQQLNAVAGPGAYKPLLPMAAIVCADIAKSYSMVPADRAKGWMAERDFGVWIPVVGPRGAIGWYLPYVFVDNVAAMVTGREVFGFFKQTATLAMPADPATAGAFSVEALVIQTFSPESQAQMMRLMTLTPSRGTGPGAPAPSGSWRSPREALEGLWGDLKRLFYDTVIDVKDLPIPMWELLKDALVDLVTGDVPMIFLKQFRDATDASKACYQAVIEAPAHLQAWYRGWFTPPHDIVIAPADSHPIATECGLGASPIHAELGFWCELEFVMQAGTVVAGG